jgi:hypothetical protein
MQKWIIAWHLTSQSLQFAPIVDEIESPKGEEPDNDELEEGICVL